MIKFQGKKIFISLLACIFMVVVMTPGQVLAKKATKEEQREDIQKTAEETLKRLYKAQPNAKNDIQDSAGYAVFSNFGMKIFIAGGGSGKGLAIDNKTQKKTYMKMAEIQAGLGFGVKKFALVWVFESRDALNRFIDSGWQLGGQAAAAAKVEPKKGAAFEGAISVEPGVWIYQLTEQGLALELTVKGTKYYKDKSLN